VGIHHDPERHRRGTPIGDAQRRLNAAQNPKLLAFQRLRVDLFRAQRIHRIDRSRSPRRNECWRPARTSSSVRIPNSVRLEFLRYLLFHETTGFKSAEDPISKFIPAGVCVIAKAGGNRTGAPSPQRTWAEKDGRPGFPATGRHQPRVCGRQLRKAS
jgi:hypothetical protein